MKVEVKVTAETTTGVPGSRLQPPRITTIAETTTEGSPDLIAATLRALADSIGGRR